MTTTPIVEAQGLTRHYDELVALDRLNLTIPAGHIYALLGPNGAGKTTTLSMLTTLLQPTEGTACVAGFDVVEQPAEVRRRIGVTFQEIVLDQELTGREVLNYHGRLYGMSRRARGERIAELLALVELEDAADRRAKTYSGGMKRRLELARGLLTHPDVLFLDEPTQGLDPQNRARVWDYLRTLRGQNGLTLLLTTHYMDEAEALADTVGIIDHGRLIVEGTPGELVAQMGADVIHVSGSGDSAPFTEQIRRLAFVQTIDGSDGFIQVGVDDGNRRLTEIVGAAGQAGFQIEEIAVARPSLGDVFLKHTGRALRDV